MTRCHHHHHRLVGRDVALVTDVPVDKTSMRTKYISRLSTDDELFLVWGKISNDKTRVDSVAEIKKPERKEKNPSAKEMKSNVFGAALYTHTKR